MLSFRLCAVIEWLCGWNTTKTVAVPAPIAIQRRTEIYILGGCSWRILPKLPPSFEKWLVKYRSSHSGALLILRINLGCLWRQNDVLGLQVSSKLFFVLLQLWAVYIHLLLVAVVSLVVVVAVLMDEPYPYPYIHWDDPDICWIWVGWGAEEHCHFEAKMAQGYSRSHQTSQRGMARTCYG